MSVANVGAALAAPLSGAPLEFQRPMPGDRGSAHKAQVQPAQRHVNALAADLEQISLAFNKKLQFVVDHRSNEVTVKVIDKETDKVIKELPPEELQRLHNKLRETIGFLFDERV